MAPPRKAETQTFSVRTTPEQIQRATELARRRGIGRSRLMIRLLEQELAAADCDQPTDPAKEKADALLAS